jgi:predicted enzyme related to lactoylglutathione lyase
VIAPGVTRFVAEHLRGRAVHHGVRRGDDQGRVTRHGPWTASGGPRHSGCGGAVATGMANISKVLARVFVADLDAAIPLYQELAEARAERFGFRDVELARIGPFLLLAGNTAAYRDRTATIQVASLAPVLAALESAGGEVIEGPAPAPNGARLIARHPDGAIFEYIETGEAR